MSAESQVLLDRLGGRMSGEMDMAQAHNAETDFLALALSTTSPTLALDCTGLTFIDSSGIHMLEHVARRSGKRVQLNHLRSNCRQVFEILDRCEEFGIPPIGEE